MIIVRFMEISLGHARMQVNTLRRVNDDKRSDPDLLMVLSLGRIGPIRGRCLGLSNLEKISGDTVIGRGIAARISAI